MFQKQPVVRQISPQELKSKIDRQEKLSLIDVREMDEFEICHLDNAKLIPLRQLPNHLKELKRDELIVVYCHYGIRSAQAVVWLGQNGFQNVANLQGGIDSWAEIVDPEMERY